MARFWIIIAGLNGFVAVALGAFGTHALQDQMSAADFENFELGSLYHLVHSLAMLAAGILARQGMPLATLAAAFFLSGIVLFSGTLYALGTTNIEGLGMIAPFGGASYMLGWILIMIGAIRFTNET